MNLAVTRINIITHLPTKSRHIHIPKCHPDYSGKARHIILIWPDFLKQFNVGTILSLSHTRWLSSTKGFTHTFAIHLLEVTAYITSSSLSVYIYVHMLVLTRTKQKKKFEPRKQQLSKYSRQLSVRDKCGDTWCLIIHLVL